MLLTLLPTRRPATSALVDRWTDGEAGVRVRAQSWQMVVLSLFFSCFPLLKMVHFYAAHSVLKFHIFLNVVLDIPEHKVSGQHTHSTVHLILVRGLQFLTFLQTSFFFLVYRTFSQAYL